MTQYELPDGFEQREKYVHKTFDEFTSIKVCYPNGDIITVHNDQWTGFKDDYYLYSSWVGWAPIVPLKRKARFVVERIGVGRYSVCDVPHENYVAVLAPTEDAAQRIADIYNEVMP